MRPVPAEITAAGREQPHRPVVRDGGQQRRVRRSDVLALTRRAPTRDQERSRWLHTAIAGHLVAEPDRVLGQARQNLERFASIHEGTMAARWLGDWKDALDSGPDQVLAVLMSDTSRAADLRQNSPFTSILPEDERRKVLNSFRAHWRAEHSRDT
jgi:hypothetical protein